MRVLAVNAGSSSLKLSLVGPDDEVLSARELAAPQAGIDGAQLRAALEGELGSADAVAHRIVHGGEQFRAPVRIDDRVVSALHALVDLAPLHQPKSLAALGAVSDVLGDRPAIACFDTAFHHTLAPAAATYALPARWRERWGLRRYGFHGLSHAWVARRVAAWVGPPPDGEMRIVSCHLGAGASLCAIRGGVSVDTTMGFTPLEGLVMATRSGSVDPGLLLWLLERETMSVRELAEALEHESGLLALAGTADMRAIAEARDARSEAALAVYLHRLRAAIAAMTATLGGLDVLAFTGGVGERSATVRERAAAGLGFLGIGIDASANRRCAPDAELTAPGCAARTLVIHAREDAEMARQARGVLGVGASPGADPAPGLR